MSSLAAAEASEAHHMVSCALLGRMLRSCRHDAWPGSRALQSGMADACMMCMQSSYLPAIDSCNLSPPAGHEAFCLSSVGVCEMLTENPRLASLGLALRHDQRWCRWE